jgi:4-hydroxybenzoate polyprenyltransferase
MIGVADYLLVMHNYQKVNFNLTHYILLVFSTVLIAAAGNMINDYFDIKADRINKPDRLIVSKYIKKRWVIILHWSFNALAFLIGVYLSYQYKTLVFAFVHLVSINMLWFYSTYFKKKLLLGNGMIGLLTTLVPLLSVWFFSALNESQLTHSPFHEETWSHVMHYNFIYLLAICAGIQNFGREIVKDAEDVEGDKLIQVKSLAMKFGGRIAVLIALCLIQLSSILGILFFCVNNEFLNGYEIYFLGIASALNGIILIVYLVNKKIKIRTVHLILKVTMLIGLGSLFSVFI